MVGNLTRNSVAYLASEMDVDHRGDEKRQNDVSGTQRPIRQDRNPPTDTGPRRDLYQGALIMTHRDRAGDPSGHRAGRREAAGDAGHRQGFPTPHRFARRRFACATGTAASQGFRAAHGFETGRMASDVPHRYATRVLAESLGKPSLWVIISAPWYLGAIIPRLRRQGKQPRSAAYSAAPAHLAPRRLIFVHRTGAGAIKEMPRRRRCHDASARSSAG